MDRLRQVQTLLLAHKNHHGTELYLLIDNHHYPFFKTEGTQQR